MLHLVAWCIVPCSASSLYKHVARSGGELQQRSIQQQTDSTGWLCIAFTLQAHKARSVNCSCLVSCTSHLLPTHRQWCLLLTGWYGLQHRNNKKRYHHMSIRTKRAASVTSADMLACAALRGSMSSCTACRLGLMRFRVSLIFSPIITLLVNAACS